jgi:tetratricopeptide (TPR) repeat protein
MSRLIAASMLTLAHLALFATATTVHAAPPEAAIAAHREGMRLAKSNQLPEALESLQRAVQLDPEYAEAWADLGNTQLAAGDMKSAIRSFEAAVKLRADFQIARYNLAYALRKTGSYPKAAEQYRLYLMRDPQDADAHYGLAEALKASGDLFAAAEAYDEYARVEKRPGQQKWIAKAEEQAKSLRKQAAKKSESASAGDAPPEPPRGKTEAKSGKQKHLSFSARAKKEEAAPAPEAPPSRERPVAAKRARPEAFRAGIEALKQNDFAGALPRLTAAAKEAPEDGFVLAALASAHLGLAQARDAEVAYRRALAVATPDAKAGIYFGLGEALRLQGEVDKALAMYRDAERSSAATASLKKLAAERIAALK